MTAVLAGLALLFGPPSPVLSTPGDQVTAGRGSYCWAGETGANGLQPYICADTFAPAPVPDQALEVQDDGRVRVDMGTDTTSLAVTVRHHGGALLVSPVEGSKREFVIRLPRHLPEDTVLDLRATYPKGSGSFAASLAVPPPPIPPKPVLRTGGATLVMARGSYCWQTPPVGLCVDTRRPLTAHALPVSRGGLVRGDLRLGADVISASIAGRPPDLQVHRARGSKSRFSFRLASYPDDRLVLRLFVRYPEGDAAFGARLRVR